jgi:putative transposase
LVYFNGVLDCADRECMGWNISQRNDAKEAACVLEDVVLRRFGVAARSRHRPGAANGQRALVCLELYRRIAKSYGLSQEFILPHTPEQNGVAESFMGTLKIGASGSIVLPPTTRPRRRSASGSATIT